MLEGCVIIILVMKKITIVFILTSLLSTSCSFLNPVSRAQNLASRGKFEEAIEILEKEKKKKPDSIPLKSILAQTYSDYGLALCQDPEKSPKVKYTKAKEQFEKALALNPYLTDAKDMYEMIEKLQETFAKNMID